MAKLQFATLSNLQEFLTLHNVQIDSKISEAVKNSIKTVSQSEDGYTLYFYTKTAPVTIDEAAFTITIPNPSGKADKVKNAVNGHLAGLDANGNLIDSGKAVTDFDESGAANTAKTEVMTYIGTIPAGSDAKTIVNYIKEIVDKKKPLDGSAAVAWSLSEIGASAIGHKHTKSDITDFPDSLKNPKGIRFLLPAYEWETNLNWIEDYDNALKSGTDSGYEIVENDRIKTNYSKRQINYYGDTTPMINLAKLYQGGGVNYLTHTTSMKFCVEGGGHDEINIWGDDLNWNILVYNGLNEAYDGSCLHFKEGSQSGDELYFKEQPDYIIASTMSSSGYDDSKESKIIFHLKKNAFKGGDNNSQMPYTFSFEVADSSHIYGPNSGNSECGIKIFNDEDNEETDTPIYQEIWGQGQQIYPQLDSRVSVSFVPQIGRNDPASQGVKIIIYGGDMQLCIRRPQLECGNIPSDWRPNIEELADGTYKSELDEMRSRYTS